MSRPGQPAPPTLDHIGAVSVTSSAPTEHVVVVAQRTVQEFARDPLEIANGRPDMWRGAATVFAGSEA